MRSVLVLALLVVTGTAAGAEDRFHLDVGFGAHQARSVEFEGLDRTGWQVSAGLGLSLSDGFSIVLNTHAGRLGTDRRVFDITDDGPTTLGLDVSLKVFTFGRAHRVAPYVSVGVGLLHTRWAGRIFTDRTENAFVVPLAAGTAIQFSRGPLSHVFVELGHDYVGRDSVVPAQTDWLNARAGVVIGWE